MAKQYKPPIAAKLDLYREFKSEYVAKKTPALVKISPAWYLAFEGRGEPGGELFQQAFEALYGVAFTIKMTRKFAGLGDYKVTAPEGLWWADDMDKTPFPQIPKSQWRWILMIRTPDFIKQKDLKDAKAALAKKGRAPAADRVRLVKLSEGQCVQVLLVGPYEGTARAVESLRAFAAGQGFAFTGRHHEIYLNDPRRVAPERLKTILRQPLRKA